MLSWSGWMIRSSRSRRQLVRIDQRNVLREGVCRREPRCRRVDPVFLKADHLGLAVVVNTAMLGHAIEDGQCTVSPSLRVGRSSHRCRSGSLRRGQLYPTDFVRVRNPNTLNELFGCHSALGRNYPKPAPERRLEPNRSRVSAVFVLPQVTVAHLARRTYDCSGMRSALEIRKRSIINILSTRCVVGLVSKNFRPLRCRHRPYRQEVANVIGADCSCCPF